MSLVADLFIQFSRGLHISYLVRALNVLNYKSHLDTGWRTFLCIVTLDTGAWVRTVICDRRRGFLHISHHILVAYFSMCILSLNKYTHKEQGNHYYFHKLVRFTLHVWTLSRFLITIRLEESSRFSRGCLTDFLTNSFLSIVSLQPRTLADLSLRGIYVPPLGIPSVLLKLSWKF